jgi:hypothetical protein
MDAAQRNPRRLNPDRAAAALESVTRAFSKLRVVFAQGSTVWVGWAVQSTFLVFVPLSMTVPFNPAATTG